MAQPEESLHARYGRRAGWLRHHLAATLNRLGAFEPLTRIRWHDVRRLVFVCQGNICRSAYAEARAKALGLRAASFGLGAHEGDRANPTALARAAARGVDLLPHRASSLSPALPGDLLVAMEPAQVARLAKRTTAPLTLLGLWAAPARPHLEDPYGLSEAYFDTCFEVIDAAIVRIARLAPGTRNG